MSWWRFLVWYVQPSFITFVKKIAAENNPQFGAQGSLLRHKWMLHAILQLRPCGTASLAFGKACFDFFLLPWPWTHPLWFDPVDANHPSFTEGLVLGVCPPPAPYLAQVSKKKLEHLEDFQLTQPDHSPQLKDNWLFILAELLLVLVPLMQKSSCYKTVSYTHLTLPTRSSV